MGGPSSFGSLAAACALAACGVLSPIPDTRTPADRAHALDERCRGFADPNAAQLLSPASVDSVEAALSHVASGPMDPEARMRGAKLYIRPLPGSSKESIERTLECHEAGVLLGKAAPIPDDPYVLADRWLEIDVDSEGDAFVVRVETNEIADARMVLERAKRFAARKNAPRENLLLPTFPMDAGTEAGRPP